MFGLFKSKTERQVLKLERLMMAVEHFHDRGQYETARKAAQEQMQVLRWLVREGEWSEAQIERFIHERGLVRSIKDPAYSDQIARALMLI